MGGAEEAHRGAGGTGEGRPSEHLKLCALSFEPGAEVPGSAKQSLASCPEGHPGGQE